MQILDGSTKNSAKIAPPISLHLAMADAWDFDEYGGCALSCNE